MADPLATLADLLAPAFGALDPEGPTPDPVVRPSDRADAQANGALPLAKRLGRSPRDVATDVLAAALPTLAGVATAEIAGPGFLNVTFDDAFLAAEVAAVAGDERLGVPTAPVARRIVVDYSAPNVAKEMHVGHLRSTIIGDALARLEMHLGHTVIRENHIGDWGTPFGMLIEHLLDLGETEAAEELSLGDLDAFYKQGRAKFDASEQFQERARQRVVLLQRGDPETLRLWQLLVDLSNQHFNAAYRRLGVLLTDDDLAGESTYNHLLPEVIDRLRDKGLLQVSDGADVVFPPGFTNRDGDPLPLIVQKRTGGFNYGTSDLACVIDRVERLHADVMLYVVGAPQAQHLAMVFEVARMAGWLQPPTEAVHVAFGNVLGADKKILKSRSGETVKLSELLDEAVQRAAAVVASKSPDLSAEERTAVADAVGIGAIKYADLSSDRIRDYVFDFDRMLSLDGNTAPYLQYAHARICSLFRRAEVDRPSVRGTVPALAEPAERALALRLLAYPTAVQATAERYALHTLCGYLYDLASDFTTFYEQCPVLRAPDEATRTSRLALADLTARVLRDGLALLGIATPERM
jgi:arginyl-tRNA synthetase